jgi:hypothetical protein
MTMRIPGHHTTPVPIMSDTNNSAGQHPTRARSRSRYSSTLSSLLVLASDRLDVEICRADSIHIPDAAPFAPILPVPTVTTPFPSLSQSVPLAVPSPSSSPDLTHRTSRPPSPAPSATDGWIPVADSNTMFDVPPSHVLSNPAIAATAASHSSRSTSRHANAPPPNSDSAYHHHPRVHVWDYADAPSRPRSFAAASRSTCLSIGPPRKPQTHSLSSQL